MIDRATELFMRACATRGVDFSRTMMLGRQEVAGGGYAESLFRELGAKSVDSIDASEFEGATIVADLNKPLPADLRRRFSVVFDGGTLEHVFDVATALRSCADLVERGGHYITVSPANNWAGHGFYQFSPELFFRFLSPEAGFRMRGTFVAELRPRQRWYRVPDARELGKRAYWRNSFRTLVFALARRDELVDLVDFAPQQSDYASAWNEQRAASIEAGYRELLRKVSPGAMREAYTSLRRRRSERFDPAIFMPVRLESIGELIAP